MPDPAAEFRSRARFMAGALLVLFPLGWAASFYPWNRLVDRAGMHLGGDFPVFHGFARLGVAGGPALYDFERQRATQFAALPEMRPETFLPALYPPFVAAALRPWAALNYVPAFFAFLGFGMAAFAATACWWAARLRVFRAGDRCTPLLLCAGCPLVWETLFGGQASFVGVAAFGGAAALLVGARPAPRTLFWAGVLLGLGAYKPNLLAIPIAALVVRWPRLLIGLAASVAALALFGGLAEGWDAWQAYFRLLTDPAARRVIGEPPPHKFHGLAALAPFTRNAGARMACGALCLLAAALAAWRWRSLPDEPRVHALGLALVGTLGLLGNPYVPTYDLVLLLPIGALAAEARAPAQPTSFRWAYAWLALAYFGPHLSQAVAQASGWQLSALPLAAFAGWLAVRFRRPPSGSA